MEEKDIKKIRAKELGNKLYEIRNKKRLTREQLAEKSNVSANYIYEIESGHRVPGTFILVDICNALDITPSQLLDDFLFNKMNSIIEINSNQFNELSLKDQLFIKDMLHYMIDLFSNN